MEGPFLFQHDNTPCTKRGPYRSGLLTSVWNNLTVLHRALTSTPLNTIGMNWNANCEPGLNRLTSVPDLTIALVAEWKQVPAEMFQHLVESLPRRVEAVIAAKGDQLHINFHDFGLRCSTTRCSHAFGHVVHVCLFGQECIFFSCLSECKHSPTKNEGIYSIDD